MTGQHDFNEVVFQDAFMPDDHVLGEVDGAWKQATSELAYERSGPERFLETFYVLTELVRVLGEKPDTRGAEGLGRLVAQVHALRRMSVSVAGMLHAGKEPVVEAAIVKDVGTIWEQKLPHKARDLAAFVEEELGQPRQLRGADDLRHHDRAQAHHPGRHHRGPARHHRPRPGAEVSGEAVGQASGGNADRTILEGGRRACFLAQLPDRGRAAAAARAAAQARVDLLDRRRTVRGRRRDGMEDLLVRQNVAGAYDHGGGLHPDIDSLHEMMPELARPDCSGRDTPQCKILMGSAGYAAI